MNDLDRKYAWSNVKSAIRSYAKNPTGQHAMQVEEAWKEIRRTDSVSNWREWRAARLSTDYGSGQSRQGH